MIYPHNEKHGEIELNNNSIFLYHSTLLQLANNKDATKKDLLLLYLFGYREISRYQILNLLSYSHKKNNASVDVFINRLIKSGYLQKVTKHKSTRIEDKFFSTKKGNDSGKEIFSSTLKKTLADTKNTFHDYVSMLLWNEESNIGEYVTMFTGYVERQNHSHPSRHMAATMDSFVILLGNLPAASLQGFRTEASISHGKVNPSHSLPSHADLRCDALFYLPLKQTAKPSIPYPDESLLVCIEQDTLRQSSAVLTDKIERYIDLLLSPRLQSELTPPVLVFSVLPYLRKKKKKETSCLGKNDKKNMEAIICFGILYCRHTGIAPENVSLEDFARELRYWHDNDNSFKKYTSYLACNLDMYGRTLPLSMLYDRFLELSSPKDLHEPIYARYKDSYARRKETIFSAVLSIPAALPAAMKGFSVCTANNYEPATLLSLFPAQGDGDSVFRDFLYGKGAPPDGIESIPFYRHEYGDGTEVTFRHAYRSGTEAYVVENVSEDALGELRLRHLLAKEKTLSVRPVAIVASDDFPRVHETVLSLASPQQRQMFYYWVCTPTQDGGIDFGMPALLP